MYLVQGNFLTSYDFFSGPSKSPRKIKLSLIVGSRKNTSYLYALNIEPKKNL